MLLDDAMLVLNAFGHCHKLWFSLTCFVHQLPTVNRQIAPLHLIRLLWIFIRFKFISRHIQQLLFICALFRDGKVFSQTKHCVVVVVLNYVPLSKKAINVKVRQWIDCRTLAAEKFVESSRGRCEQETQHKNNFKIHFSTKTKCIIQGTVVLWVQLSAR